MRSFTNIAASAFVLGASLLGLPAAAADVTLDAGPGLKWVTPTDADGTPDIPLRKGDVLIIRQADASIPHGLKFTGPGALSTIPLCDLAPAAGTVFCLVSPYNRRFAGLGSGTSAKGEMLRLRVLEDLTTDMPFDCVVHGGGMKGTLKKVGP